jgi:hypothetical protein
MVTEGVEVLNKDVCDEPWIQHGIAPGMPLALRGTCPCRQSSMMHDA